MIVFVLLVFNGTFSTTKLYRAIGEQSVLSELWRDDHDEDEQLIWTKTVKKKLKWKKTKTVRTNCFV